MVTNDQLIWLRDVLKINVTVPDAAEANDEGVIERAVGAEYEGEHDTASWHVGSKDPDERAKMKASPGLVTRKYNDEEREDHTVRVDETGTVRDTYGNPATIDEKVDYVVHPKTGDIHYTESEFVYREMQNGQPTGDADYAEYSDFKARQDEIKDRVRQGLEPDYDDRFESEHHSTPLAGGNVASAGGVTIEDGKVKRIDNNSGHYKPQLVHLLQVVENLVKQGAMLNTTLEDAKERGEKDNDPEAEPGFKLYHSLKPLIGELPALRKKLFGLQAGLEAAGPGDEGAAIAEQIEQVEERLNPIKDAMVAIARLGIGPRNSFLEEAKVGVIDVKPTMRGVDVKRAQVRDMPAGEFLEGGGDETAYASKKAMLAEFELSTGKDLSDDLDRAQGEAEDAGAGRIEAGRDGHVPGIVHETTVPTDREEMSAEDLEALARKLNALAGPVASAPPQPLPRRPSDSSSASDSETAGSSDYEGTASYEAYEWEELGYSEEEGPGRAQDDDDAGADADEAGAQASYESYSGADEPDDPDEAGTQLSYETYSGEEEPDDPGEPGQQLGYEEFEEDDDDNDADDPYGQYVPLEPDDAALLDSDDDEADDAGGEAVPQIAPEPDPLAGPGPELARKRIERSIGKTRLLVEKLDLTSNPAFNEALTNGSGHAKADEYLQSFQSENEKNKKGYLQALEKIANGLNKRRSEDLTEELEAKFHDGAAAIAKAAKLNYEKLAGNGAKLLEKVERIKEKQAREAARETS